MADDDSLITAAPPQSSAAANFYPFATSPDVIRSHEKDVYITGSLTSQAHTIARSLRGARFAHAHTEAVKNLTEILYLSLTTLLGNRTLGEEYCDVVQLEDDTLQLPSLARRAGYILSSVLAPWALQRILPTLRRKLRAKLERSIARQQARAQNQGQKQQTNKTLYFQTYILQHLDSLTSLSPIYALSIATFYFTGSYYHLSKRFWGLRYVFTKKVADSEQRIGYEVLGALMVCQMMVQGILHIRQTIHAAEASQDPSSSTTKSTSGQTAPTILPPASSAEATPVLPPDTPRYDLSTSQASSFTWIPSEQQRKCTLCLELFKDPSVTTCGHVFCWTCIRDWVKEKPECPLCRQSVMGSKVLPLRG
ncbi:peroxisome biogenesis factor 10 [Arachnomyces sp. PD_36]|nr:peroxisome biogenesis factor 10 [Arachnomyces sp. PD_36]